MGHADPKVRIAAPRSVKNPRFQVIESGEAIVARRVVSAAATRRTMRAILRNMPKTAQGRESIRAKLQAVRQRG